MIQQESRLKVADNSVVQKKFFVLEYLVVPEEGMLL
jgi:hypothetical protein